MGGRRADKGRGSTGFGADVIDENELARADHFGLIGADNDYMDDELDGGDAFFADLEVMRDSQGPAGDLDARAKRSTAFNEVIENPFGDEAAGLGNGGKPRTEAKDDDLAFQEVIDGLDGEQADHRQSESVLGDAGLKFSLTDKMRKRSAVGKQKISVKPTESEANGQDEEESAAEANDKVAELPGTERSNGQLPTAGARRFASVTSSSDFYSGMKGAGAKGGSK